MCGFAIDHTDDVIVEYLIHGFVFDQHQMIILI